MAKILITGSKGVLGSYLTKMLEDKGHKVFGIDLQHAPGEIGWEQEMSKWVNEMQIRNSILRYDTKTVIVRIFNTYGPDKWYHPYRSVNCKFCYPGY